MAKASVGSKNKQAAAIKEQDVLESVADLGMESLSSDIAKTQVEVQETLAGLSAKLTARLQVLRNIEGAIGLKEQELAQLYEIEKAVTTLDDLHLQIKTKKQEWEDEEVAQKRKAAEQQAERQRAWARSEEEYAYKTAMDRRKAEDLFASKMALMNKEAAEKQEALEKDWAGREGELKKRETELNDMRQQVANFPEVIKKEVNAAVAIATNSLKKEYETKIVLAAKDSETAAKLATQEVASLTATQLKLHAQIDDLKAQLEQAHRDVKEISAKAFESVSGRSAMEALQKVLEKDQPQRPGK